MEKWKKIWSITTSDLEILIDAETTKLEMLNTIYKGDTSKWMSEYYFGYNNWNETVNYTLTIYVRQS